MKEIYGQNAIVMTLLQKLCGLRK